MAPLVRTGVSRHTGLAALPHRNIHMIDQNQKMLSTLRRTEANTEQTAQYAKLSANYSRTCAYFSMANYLEKNF